MPIKAISRKVSSYEVNGTRYSKTSTALPAGDYFELTTGASSIFTDDLAFAKRPYVLIQRKANEWYLVVPKFIDIRAGWMAPIQSESFNIFIINRFMDWITPLGDEIKQEIKFTEVPKLLVQQTGTGTNLIIAEDKAGADWAQQHYKELIFQRLDDTTLKTKKMRAFNVIDAMIKDGILPFSPNPIPLEARNPPLETITLRDYQAEAFSKFLDTGAVGVFYPPGAGKTYLSLCALHLVKGKQLVVVPSITLLEQWTESIHKYLPRDDWGRITVTTYQSAGKDSIKNREYALLVVDEVHHLPANTFSGISMINAKYRLGLSATPFREDGREDLIFALTGYPVGIDWDRFFSFSVIQKPTAWLKIARNDTEKIRITQQLLLEEFKGKKTLIFCDDLTFGEMASRTLNIPFVSGESKNRIQTLNQNLHSIISRVGDEGIDLPELNGVIEIKFLYGSRRQELQRIGRLMHSKFKGKLIILMTEHEFNTYHKRLYSLIERGIEIKRL